MNREPRDGEHSGAVACARFAHRPERRVHALVGRGQLIGVQAHVELGDVEPEQLDAAPQVLQDVGDEAGFTDFLSSEGRAFSNHERGAGAPHSVCRRGSFRDQRSGSWSWSMVK